MESDFEEKRHLLAKLSHEIRTPMNVVMGMAALLSATPLNPRQKEMVEVLRTNIDLMLKQTNHLLTAQGITPDPIPPRENPVPLPVQPADGSGTVLLVEDYPANIMVATLMLENLGFKVDVAPSGKQALEKIGQAQGSYAAILMDVQMNEMDGYETTRRIRVLEQEKGFHHAIIGVTAHAMASDRERCLASGMDDYMSKPIHPDILAQKMASLRHPA